MEQEEESKTIMLRGLPLDVIEEDVSVTDYFLGQSHIDCVKFDGASIILMKLTVCCREKFSNSNEYDPLPPFFRSAQRSSSWRGPSLWKFA